MFPAAGSGSLNLPSARTRNDLLDVWLSDGGYFEEEIMKRMFLISVATAALFVGTGPVIAQAPNATGSQGAPVEKSAPAEKMAPMNRNAPTARPGSENGLKGSQADEGMRGDKGAAERPQAAEPKSRTGGKADSEMSKDKSKEGTKADTNGAAKSGTTSGQAGAGSKQLTSEQRTSVRTAIRGQNVKPETNVNFTISVGTRVPRTVTFHPVPTELVTIYPDWRGFEYFLVGDEIIVVNPRTLEIVAVLEA